MAERPVNDRPGGVSVVHAIVAANVLVFVMWLWPVVPAPTMADHFLVSWQHLAEGRVWVLLTAVFSHNILFHLLINMIVLVSFGIPLERAMGAVKFLGFYLIAGVVGSFAHAATSSLLMDAPGRAALGASAAVAGLLLLFSLSFPRARVLLFFIIPLPAIVAALLFIGIDVWGLIVQIDDGGLPIGHGAHLGGALVGIVYFVFGGRVLRGGQAADQRE
jgi:membrane associated rhomboid family serine protease